MGSLFSRKTVLLVLLVLLVLALSAVSAMAQTPIPTLNLPIGDVITAANNWTPSLAPIVTLGIGASLAITVLLFLGGMLIWGIRSALKSVGFGGGKM